MTKEQLDDLQTLAFIDYKTRLQVHGVRIVEVKQCSSTVATNAVQSVVVNTKQPQLLN